VYCIYRISVRLLTRNLVSYLVSYPRHQLQVIFQSIWTAITAVCDSPFSPLLAITLTVRYRQEPWGCCQEPSGPTTQNGNKHYKTWPNRQLSTFRAGTHWLQSWLWHGQQSRKWTKLSTFDFVALLSPFCQKSTVANSLDFVEPASNDNIYPYLHRFDFVTRLHTLVKKSNLTACHG